MAEGLRQTDQAPTGHLGHRGIELGRDVARHEQEAQQRPQPAHDVLGRTHLARRALGKYEVGHLAGAQTVETDLAVT